MNIHPGEPRRPRKEKIGDVLGMEPDEPVLFSAKDALLPRLDALRADRVNLDDSGKKGLPLDMATLALLLPEQTRAEQADLVRAGINVENVERWGNHMVLLLLYGKPELLSSVIQELRKKYPREVLKKRLVDSLDPRYRPHTSAVVMGRLLYPDAPDIDLEDGLRDRLVARIINLQKFNPSMQGDAAEMVLIDPSLKSEFQPHFLDCLDKYNKGELFDWIDKGAPNSSDIIRDAFYLEVLYGDTFAGLDRQGKMKYAEKPLGSVKPLPNRSMN